MKRILVLLLILALCFTFIGCEGQASKVSYNLSEEADNFNIIRQVTVMHGITGEVQFQMTGRLSIEVQNYGLDIIVEYEKGMYAKHFIFTGDNGQVVVEQLRPANVSEYNYTLNMNPKLWIPVEVDVID